MKINQTKPLLTWSSKVMSSALTRWQLRSVCTVNSQKDVCQTDARLPCLEQRLSMLSHLQNVFPIPGVIVALESLSQALLCSQLTAQTPTNHSPVPRGEWISGSFHPAELFSPSCLRRLFLTCYMLRPSSCVQMHIIVIYGPKWPKYILIRSS